MVNLIDRHTSNYGDARDHWRVMRDGQHIGQVGHERNRAWADWSFMSKDGAIYETFKSKAALLAFAAKVAS